MHFWCVVEASGRHFAATETTQPSAQTPLMKQEVIAAAKRNKETLKTKWNMTFLCLFHYINVHQ